MNVRVWWAVILQFNVWLCGTSLLMVAASTLALSIPLREVGLAILLPALLFYFIYVEDRRAISPADRVNNPYRTQLMERYSRALLASELVALVGYELLLVWQFLANDHVGPGMVFLGQLPLVVLAVYSTLKRVPTFDSIAVAATWSFAILYSVALSTPVEYSTGLLAVAGAWFLLVFAGAESRNVLDIAGDTDADRTTLAGYLGPQYTRYLEIVLKTTGVLIFWAISTLPVVVLVCTYLVLLRVFRSLTRSTSQRTLGVNTT